MAWPKISIVSSFATFSPLVSDYKGLTLNWLFNYKSIWAVFMYLLIMTKNLKLNNWTEKERPEQAGRSWSFCSRRWASPRWCSCGTGWSAAGPGRTRLSRPWCSTRAQCCCCSAAGKSENEYFHSKCKRLILGSKTILNGCGTISFLLILKIYFFWSVFDRKIVRVPSKTVSGVF